MMLTNEDLLAISQMLDETLEIKLEEKLEQKLDEKLEQKLDEKLDSRFEDFEKKLDKKFDEKLDSRFEGFRLELEEHFDTILNTNLQPIHDRLRRIELMQENDILPRLQNIEACYVTTYRRYAEGIEKLDTLQTDVDILKQVVAKHSEQLQKLA